MSSASGPALIKVYTVAGITTIALDRPRKRNALNDQMVRELDEALSAARADESVSVVILTSTDPSAFCAGGDLNEVKAADLDVRQRNADAVHRMRWNLVTLPQPTIAAVAGHAHGAGAELATACDVCIVADNAKFRFSGVAVARISGTQRLSRLVGLSRAKELVFTTRILGAIEAERIGLAIRRVSTEEILQVAQEVARAIAANDRRTLVASKRLLNETFSDDHWVGYQKEADALREAIVAAESGSR